jgi:hypothetical protein
MAHAIPPLDLEAMRDATARQQRLTKPAGSLGRLEELSIRLAGMTGRLDPPLDHAVVFTLAADHWGRGRGRERLPPRGHGADGAQLPARWGGDLDWRRAAVSLVAVAACTLAIVVIARRRIGGATGDVCGATVELGQLATLLVFAAR